MKPKVPKEEQYVLSGSINGELFIETTSDIKKSITSRAPKEIFTESYITLSKGEGANKIVNEQRLDFIKTKRVFRDENALDIFVQNLLVPFN